MSPKQKNQHKYCITYQHLLAYTIIALIVLSAVKTWENISMGIYNAGYQDAQIKATDANSQPLSPDTYYGSDFSGFSTTTCPVIVTTVIVTTGTICVLGPINPPLQ